MTVIRKKEGDKDLFISHLSVKGLVLKKEQRLLPLNSSVLLYNKDHVCFNLKSQGFFLAKEELTRTHTYCFNFINFF